MGAHPRHPRLPELPAHQQIFHIILAFPNTWYSKLEPRTQVRNMPRITEEEKLMMDPLRDPYAAG